ncbi:hypothetical protein GCM10020221_12300 [Streptomyces thioluteus]|uniref:Uncharacterized protein n=1 Tax=Streptomyces thioluteus TaxID=66431 RepID=A0ABN3WJC1_STRTU
MTPSVWERGILVSSAADVNAGPVADFTMAVVLLAAKKCAQRAAAGRPSPHAGDTDGTVIGIVQPPASEGEWPPDCVPPRPTTGYLLHDPYATADQAARIGTELVDIHTLCTKSAIVTLHAPQLPETRIC